MRRKHRVIILAVTALALCAVIAGLSLYRKGNGMEPGKEGPSAEFALGEGEGPKVLVMALDEPLDSAYGKLALAYKEEVESMSGGTLTIDIYENALLGDSTELLATIGADANAADIILVPVDGLVEAGCSDTASLLESYRFKSHDALMKWVKSKDAAALLTDPEKSGAGVTGLFFSGSGFRYLFLKEGSKDVKDKTIAAGADDPGEEYVKQIGGKYVYMPSIDIKGAIFDGTLDGAEQYLKFYQEVALWEAAPYIVTDYHLASICEAVITLEAAEGLSKEELDILKAAGEKAAGTSMEAVKQEEEAMLDGFSEYGAKMVKLKK